MPITEPVPDSLTRELLAQHGLRLFPVADYPQSTRSVRRLGFVCRDAKLFLLDEAIRDQTIEHRDHPLALATRWTAAGFSALAAFSWVRSGTLAPDAAHRSITTEANVTTPAARLIPLLVAPARRSLRRLPPTTPQRG